MSAESLVQHVLSHHKHQHHHHEEEGEQEHETTALTKCTSNSSLDCGAPATVAHKHRNFEISERDLLHLCPALLYSLANHSDGCIEPTLLGEIDHYEIQQKDDILYGE